jgi:hypothetical protein
VQTDWTAGKPVTGRLDKWKEAVLFFEKKPKKLLSICRFQRGGPGVAARRDQGEKSFFGSFFSKKELLAFLTDQAGQRPPQRPVRMRSTSWRTVGTNPLP